jgi:hypothetical protein
LIKVFYDGCSALFYNRQTSSILRISDAFDTNDIKFTGWGPDWEEPDIIWVTPDKLTNNIIESGKPIILEDFKTGPDIYDQIRKQYHGNVRALIKMMALRDRTEYNSHHTNWVAHCHRIAQVNPDIKCDGGITGEHLDINRQNNIRVLWNWIAWPLFRPARGPAVSFSAYQFTKTRFDTKRTHDVHFLGCTHFDTGQVPHANSDYHDTCTLLTRHRQQAIDQLRKIKRPKLVDLKRLNRLDYLISMQNAKIVVSPWGWEPCTYRDLEAALCGCVVVKPDTSFLETWPEINYVPCKADFSDLPDTINQVLDNWDNYHKFRLDNFNRLQNIGDDTLSKRFASIVKDYVFKDII